MNPRKKVDLKLIIIGALGVGKTSLLHRFVHKTFYEDYQTTLGASILSKIIILDDTTLKLQIWDTGGQERFRSMVSTFYKGSDGCVLAFDVTDVETFEALETWRGDVLAKTIPMEQSYPMVVLGNKIDLADRQASDLADPKALQPMVSPSNFLQVIWIPWVWAKAVERFCQPEWLNCPVKNCKKDFPGGAVVKNPPGDAGTQV
ncbi:ras-related protein Rab-7b isoform X1 [Balaenoptera acutorostrata]|uniref:Ras-related protein Rab-7b isoform X1 n=1 Tax=Balaenoptera acutorostrata TaxID=9767 RepID=A0ABM3TN91_BALAC|nr:ras-related protein Rab-7b isoform X1 [Balaenoptera acutorostrata]XP_057395544.1 ras-related protein Rab-7b isoform X1 [Balaenoptera acutorostrata]XP_057403550.1 ras-related protein Rab-7b isoform X1 [Balaenoptera acutorostrata]XP_057403552.1 ras-related protein Rab-7b isoform X1 [Balaenoptera acutorostrata]